MPKPERQANTARLNCMIRVDVKAALHELAARRHMTEGGYVGLTRIINEAALLLLEQEGVLVESYPQAPSRRPAKATNGRKRSAA